MASLEHLHNVDNDDSEDSDDSSTSTGTSNSLPARSATSSNTDGESEINTDDYGPTATSEADDADIKDLEPTAAKNEESTGTPDSRAFQIPQHAGSSAPPRTRIKLSLRLPTKANKGKSSLSRKETKSDDIQTATVAASDEEEEAVAEVLPSSTSSTVAIDYTSVTPKPAKKKIKPIRVPPMSSPGLMIPASSGLFRGESDTNGFSSPAALFDHCMTQAGYTIEDRTENPHRGSSVKRVVGDMFDSDVKLTQNFPKLVPTELMQHGQEGELDNDEEHGNTKKRDFPFVHLLVRALTCKDSSGKHGNDEDLARKRKHSWSFQSMIPLSLTIPYPQSFIAERATYINKVEAREAAIVTAQETIIETEKLKEKYKEDVARKSVADMPPPPVLPTSVEVPPIPEPPAPPKLADFEADVDWQVDDTKHPLYPPKNNPEFVEHLDPNCFHITEGRYFGLLTNSIADPHFLGPSAPGIAGLTVSAGTSLATSYVGHQSAGSASLASTVYGNSSSQTPTKTPREEPAVERTVTKPILSKEATAPTVVSVPKGPKVSFVKKVTGPSPTSSSTELKKLMESTGAAREAMRVCIVRAAVYASRTSRHGQSFIGSNGQVYPDVARAFAAWADMKPCERCKNNKQGAYHCRLRRKHKELDHDGGDSPALLAPLFLEPLEDLIAS